MSDLRDKPMDVEDNNDIRAKFPCPSPDYTREKNAEEFVREPHLVIMKIGTALFYATSSFFITVVNKSVLTSYQFPSFQFLAFGQMLTTVIVLFVCKKLNVIKFPNFHRKTFTDLFPLPLIYVGNMVSGLGSTKELSLPMFTMLRRVSVLMTMIGEYYVLNIKPKLSVQISVALMIIGAAIAAIHDLGFSLHGYIYVLINDALTAGSNIYTKQKLDSRKEMGKYGLMFYSAFFMLPLSSFILWQTGDLTAISNYPMWFYTPFLIQFLLSCFMGFVLNYSVMLCTQFNSALTTTIIGCLKNILLTYVGMFVGGDYIYSTENFIGINISVFASILYTYITFKPARMSSESSAIPLKYVITKV